MPDKDSPHPSKPQPKVAKVQHTGKKIRGTSFQKVKAFLDSSRHLSSSEYEDLVNEEYGRAALYVLARVACSGDVAALQLYFKVLKDWEGERKRGERTRPAQRGASFLAERKAEPEVIDAKAEPDEGGVG